MRLTRVRSSAFRRSSLLLILSLLLPACATTVEKKIEPATTQREAGGAPISRDMRDTLAMLLRAHDQKTQLAFYAGNSLPMLKNVDEPFKDFFYNMGKAQGDLEKELKKWAADRHVDLTFHFTNDIGGHAQKLMEDREGDVAKKDNKVDFERDELINMYMDYEWQIALITTALPQAVHDPVLHTYLEHSLTIHQAGSKEIRSLIQKFHFQP